MVHGGRLGEEGDAGKDDKDSKEDKDGGWRAWCHGVPFWKAGES